jgi:probable F420-dependent oxidoreductase
MAEVGICLLMTQHDFDIVGLARKVEELGFGSLWAPEHGVVPADFSVGESGARSGAPSAYSDGRINQIIDPLVYLAAAAAATTSVRLGTGICLVIERDPIIMAKEVASVDRLSNGRLFFGIGGGWNAEEMENHGAPFKRRWKVLRERIEAMKEIWANEEAEYHGEFVNFDKIWCYPKPAQKPHPPILLGTFNGGLKRVVNYCDGWVPVGFDTSTLSESIKELHALAEQAGRSADEIPVSIFGSSDKEDALASHQELGIERAVLFLPSADRDTLMPTLDKYASLVPKFAS